MNIYIGCNLLPQVCISSDVCVEFTKCYEYGSDFIKYYLGILGSFSSCSGRSWFCLHSNISVGIDIMKVIMTITCLLDTDKGECQKSPSKDVIKSGSVNFTRYSACLEWIAAHVMTQDIVEITKLLLSAILPAVKVMGC